MKKLTESILQNLLSDPGDNLEERLEAFNKALDELCKKTKSSRVGELDRVRSPYVGRDNGIWYKQQIKLPDGALGALYFDAYNNIYDTSFEKSDLYYHWSGMGAFKGNFDYLVDGFNDTELIESRNKKEFEDEKRCYINRVCSYIGKKQTKKYGGNTWLDFPEEQLKEIIIKDTDKYRARQKAKQEPLGPSFRFFKQEHADEVTYDEIYNHIQEKKRFYKSLYDKK